MIITNLLKLLCFLNKVLHNYDFPPNVWIKTMYKNYGVSFFRQVAQAERLDRENISALSSFGFHCFWQVKRYSRMEQILEHMKLLVQQHFVWGQKQARMPWSNTVYVILEEEGRRWMLQRSEGGQMGCCFKGESSVN